MDSVCETIEKGSDYILSAAYGIGGGDCTDARSRAKPLGRLEWMNYWFTEYGAIVANYGTEGSSFVFDANGASQWTKLIEIHFDFSIAI